MTEHFGPEQIARAVGDLPTMPHIANLAMEKLSDPNVTSKEIERIIYKDQAIAARILRIANSAAYSRRRAILTISDAVLAVGFKTIKTILITSALHDFFKTFGLAEKLMWRHSLVCAFICRMIGQKIKFSNVEEVFLAGLLHDVGKVVLYLKVPQKMLLIVQEVYNNPGHTFIQLEQHLFGFNHAQLGELVAKKWNFGPEIVEAIGRHHRPETAEVQPPLTYIVHLGNSFCHKLEVGFTRRRDLNLEELSSAKFLGLDKPILNELFEGVSRSLEADADLFAL